MQAIILAAGMGKRLKELTQNNTKCMVKVDGVSLIERMLNQITAIDVSRIVIVIGYKGRELKDYIATLGISTPIIFVENPIYDKTNNIYSLALAKDWLCTEDTLLFESDLIFEDSVLKEIVDDERDSLVLVDKYEAWMDGTCLKINEADEIEAFIPGSKLKFGETNEYYKTVNIYKFSKAFSSHYYVPFLEAYQSALGRNEYYEQVLKVITMLDTSEIKAKRLTGQKWYEIDDIQDLDIAESIFAKNEEDRIQKLLERYGGYWRYPGLLDFCYLVNPYFPPKQLVEELKANFDKLLTEYPSGMKVNSLLAGKNFGVKQENIVIGNGAAELIKVLMEDLKGNTGFVRPTFEEYPNRYNKKRSIYYYPENDDYSYTSSDIIDFFNDKEVDNILIVNPDNPTGNYIPKEGLLKLINWTKQNGITLIIDESFADFATEKDNSLIYQDILDANKHLFVVKSISKSYGVPGLRLGVIVSGDSEIISQMKKDVAIWNINSFAEYYMQIEEKYKKDYLSSLIEIKTERKRFMEELQQLKDVRVIPSEANYFMVELTGTITVKRLQERLLINHNILIKNLENKVDGKQFMRIAVRDTIDNDLLINAMKEELS